MLRGALLRLPLANHRYLLAQPHTRSLGAADAPGTTPDRLSGTCFWWEVVKAQ